jgi:phosphatidate cytidylyltransferase
MLKQRTLTALVLAPIGIALILLLPTAALAVVVGAMCLQALWEWTRLAGLSSHPLRAAIIAANAVLLGLLWVVRDEPLAWLVVAAGIAWWLLALLWMRAFSWAAAPTPGNAVIKLVAGEFAILPAWMAMLELHAGDDRGHVWALLSLMLVWVADTAAYFAGKRYGTRKLAPRISPNKTTAGAWGALAGAAALALAAGLLLGERGLALEAMVVLALLVVGASIAGDLFESLLKRQAGVKDSGTLFPGHGGLLDRFDSLFAAIPVFAAGKALLDLAFGT